MDRTFLIWRMLALCAMALAASGAAASGQENPRGGEPASLGAKWPMERLTLADGTTLSGLVRSESPASIEFLEVRRPPGKPMFLLLRWIRRERIASWRRLPADEQQRLRARLEQHKRRTRIEGRRMEDLALAPTSDDGHVIWNYRGHDFSLECTANELTTRRLVVRLEQIFSAYRQLLPPQWHDRRRVEIRVYGSVEQYQTALAEARLRINNPAVYLADRNLILAGSEMNRFDARLAKINRQHHEIREQLDALVVEARARVEGLGEELKNNNVPATERLRILLAEQRQWHDHRKAVQRKIVALDRRNAARFDEVTGRMFRRLAHEAFHAYLETYVYPRRVYDVPRWLNEGLAQTFEAGLLEADSLRIDAPNRVALAKLQEDLRGGAPLPLAELLAAPSDAFLGVHGDGAAGVSRAYYYSWGLAYYLAFEQGVLSPGALDAYLSPADSEIGPVRRFERLAGAPVAEFEARWREAMLGLEVD